MKAKYLQAIDKEDLLAVRLYLANEILLDPRGDSFSEMKNLAESKLSNLYDVDNGKKYSSSVDDWNEDLLFSVRNDLDDNFSFERLDLFAKIAKVALKDKIAELDRKELAIAQKPEADHSGKPNGHQRKNSDSSNKLYRGIAIGGVVVAATGLCVSKTGLACLGFAGMLVGGYLLFTDKNK